MAWAAYASGTRTPDKLHHGIQQIMHTGIYRISTRTRSCKQATDFEHRSFDVELAFCKTLLTKI